jgi:translocation protein SEC63
MCQLEIYLKYQTADLCRNLIYAHLNRLDVASSLESEKLQIIGETIRLQKGLLEIALAFNYFEPIRAAMELSQHILQAIPIGGSPLLQLPGITSNIAKDLCFHEKPIRNIQDLLYLSRKEQRKALEALTNETFHQAINIAKQIPILIVSNIHFKGK